MSPSSRSRPRISRPAASAGSPRGSGVPGLATSPVAELAVPVHGRALVALGFEGVAAELAPRATLRADRRPVAGQGEHLIPGGPEAYPPRLPLQQGALLGTRPAGEPLQRVEV